MHTLSKKEQSKWISYEPKKEVNRIREAVNFTAVFVFVATVGIAFLSI
ncbi:TMhelix containing protein [Vibrio phage 1.178.O._10N.286.45.E12]|nr:TMhelix containing protein [Vibrio phage 1.178.O._10N.286.45.E12]